MKKPEKTYLRSTVLFEHLADDGWPEDAGWWPISGIPLSPADCSYKWVQKGFDRFGLFVQDYGGPVGFRIVMKIPDVLESLIIQNTNACEMGFTPALGWTSRCALAQADARERRGSSGLLAYDMVKAVYLHGSTKPELISPDNWNSDFFTTIQKPNGRQIQLDLFYDYRTNVAFYPKWQSFLKEKQPKTILFWGQDDIFSTREGGEAYLKRAAEGREASA